MLDILAQDQPDPVLMNQLNVVKMVFCGLSVIALFLLLITSCLLKTYKGVFGQMIMISAVCSLIYSTPFDYLIAPGEIGCDVASFLNEFGLIASCLWSAFYAHLLTLVVYNKTYSIRRLLVIYSSSSLVISILFGLLALKTKYSQYDVAAELCLHVNATGEMDWSLLNTRILPVFLMIIVSLIFYSLISNKLRIIKKYLNHGSSKSSFFILLLFPAILILLWVPITVTCAIIAIRRKDTNEVLYAVLFLATKLHGLIMTIIYFISGRVRNGISKLIYKKSPRNSSALVLSSLSSNTEFEGQAQNIYF